MSVSKFMDSQSKIIVFLFADPKQIDHDFREICHPRIKNNIDKHPQKAWIPTMWHNNIDLRPGVDDES